jgi:hypothetical protein
MTPALLRIQPLPDRENIGERKKEEEEEDEEDEEVC